MGTQNVSSEKDQPNQFGRGAVSVGIVLAAIWLFFPTHASKSSGSSKVEWFQGGTLHGSTVGEWNAASYRNRLATAADWTTGIIGQAEFERIGLSGVRQKAEELVKCVDGSISDLSGAESLSATEIAAMCATLMKL